MAKGMEVEIALRNPPIFPISFKCGGKIRKKFTEVVPEEPNKGPL